MFSGISNYMPAMPTAGDLIPSQRTVVRVANATVTSAVAVAALSAMPVVSAGPITYACCVAACAASSPPVLPFCLAACGIALSPTMP